MHESRRDRAITIDGLQLLFPRTGLAPVTSELVRALQSMSPAISLTLILPRGVSLPAFELEPGELEILEVQAPRISPDYFFRAEWGRRVAARLRHERPPGRLFIPYLFNYGRWSENLVFLPDLVHRLVPDYGTRNPVRPWWNLRGRLPLRLLVRRFEEWKVARARRVIVQSRFVRQHAAEALRIPQAKFAEIRLSAPHWITASRHAALPPHLATSLPERFALYIGGYAPRKNVPMLLRACGAVQRRDATFRCAFAGLSPERIQQEPRLAEAWQSPGVREAAVLLPQVENSELAPLYRRAQFAIYPSRSEGFGLPLVEAAACERLCLCGDNSSMIELQPDPAYRVPAEDEAGWVERIARFWADPAGCAAAGKECAAAMSSFSWPRAAEELLAAAEGKSDEE